MIVDLEESPIPAPRILTCGEPLIATTGMTEESPGVRSSKRVAGITAMALGAALLVAVGVVAMCRLSPMPNAQITILAGQSLVAIGAALLGITVVEAFAK